MPDSVDVVEGKDGAKVRVGADGAHTDIPYRDGESDESLRERVEAATRKLRAEIDPAQSVRVQGSGEKAKIGQRPGLGGVPVPEGFPVSAEGLAPNEPGYPAKLISHGPDGQRGPQASGREDTVLGGTINFTMELDYAARSAGWQDETWNRMQRIAYKWELIDITKLDLAEVKKKLKSAGQATDSGIARDLGRNLANTWEDTKADVLDTAAHPGMEGYLAVVAVANLVDIGAELISSYFAFVSQPLNDRSIAFNEEGVFLVRCFAQPIVDHDRVDEMIAEGKRPIVRAPSVDTYPVRVTKINARALEANDADLAKIGELEKQVDAPQFPLTSEDVREQVAEARAALDDDNFQALDRQERFLDRELGRIKQWRELDDQGVALEDRDAKLRIWHAQLDLSGVAVGAYEKQLNDVKRQLPALRTRYSGFGMRGMKEGQRVVRPRMTLVSEVNGQVFPLVANLGEAARSREGARVWRLIDVTSAETQDSYEGSGATHTEAIQAAFDSFRDNSEYGRGSLAVRLPVRQLFEITQETVVLRNAVERVRPGTEARVLKRLQSLATAAEIAGMVVAGPAGLALGVIGGVAGGIVAAENLRRRASAERLHADFQTAMDIIGVVGAVVAVGGLRGLASAEAGRAGKAAAAASEGELAVARLKAMEKVADRAFTAGGMLHIAGQGLMHGQWIIMPIALYHELAAIEKEEAADLSKDKGKYRAKRLEAWARALKSGVVQVRTMQMHANPEAGWDPFRETPKAPQGDGSPPPTPTPTPTPGEPLPAPTTGDAPAPPRLPPGTPPPTPSGKPPRRTGPGDKPTVWAPERPVDATRPRAFQAVVTEALGLEHAPLPNRIRLVDAATVQVFWDTAKRKGMARGGKPGEAPVAIYDPDTGHVYVVKDAFLGSPALQQAAFDGVMGHMKRRGREALSEPVARAVGELVMQAAITGAPEISAATPEARTLQQRLTRLVGQESIERLLYRGEVAAFSAKLSEVLGSARGNALEVALRKGDLRMANRLAGEPNPAMSNAFGELLTVATADLLTVRMGGKPRAERLPGQPRELSRSALAAEVARMVGQDVLEGALFRGRTEDLRIALRERLGPDGYQAFVDAVRAGDLPASLKALREPPPLWAQAPRVEKLPLPDERAPRREERRPPTAEPGGAPRSHPDDGARSQGRGAARRDRPRGEPEGAPRAGARRDRRGGQLQVAARPGRRSPKVAEALQVARERLIGEVQAEIRRALEEKYPGVEVEFVNLGTPGFNSDMDYTINVKPGKASVNDAIAASVEGVRAAYDVFGGGRGDAVGDGFDGARQKVGGRRLPPDRVLDSNFYTELHEHAIRPRTAAERLAISGDQSVVSLAEARMNMDPGDWPAYRERMLESFEDTGADHTGTEADINDLAKQRLRGQLDAAERLVEELHPPGRTREQVLAGVQQELLDAIGSGASPREVRALQAKIKLLEPDAYGTRAAKVGVVDQYQGAARAKTRREAWDRLGQGKDGDMTPRERAADAAQEGGASAAKLRHAAPDVGATTAQAISAAKYLARVFEAFRKAGLHIDHPLIRRSGDVIGAKQETNADAAAMGELRRWAQDTHRLGLDDPQQLRDAFVQEVKRLGDELDLRLRRNEAIMAGMDPTAGELADLAALRKPSAKPPDGSSGGGAPPPSQPPKGPPSGGGKEPPSTPPHAPAPTPAAPRRGPGGFDSAAEAGRAVTEALTRLQHGMGPGETPPNYERAMQLLADPKNKSPVNSKLLKLLPIAERGLRTPELYGRVIAEAWERAVLTGTDINGALLQMARRGRLEGQHGEGGQELAGVLPRGRDPAEDHRRQGHRRRARHPYASAPGPGRGSRAARRRSQRERGRVPRAVRQGPGPGAERHPARRSRLARHLRRRGPRPHQRSGDPARGAPPDGLPLIVDSRHRALRFRQRRPRRRAAGEVAAGADRLHAARAGGVRPGHAHPVVESGRRAHLRLAGRGDARPRRPADGAAVEARGERRPVRARDRGRVDQRPRDRATAQGREPRRGLDRGRSGQGRVRPRRRQSGRLHRHHRAQGAGGAAAGADRLLAGRAGGVRPGHAHPVVESGRGAHLRLVGRGDARPRRPADGAAVQACGGGGPVHPRPRGRLGQRLRDRAAAQGREPRRGLDRGRPRQGRVRPRREQHGRVHRHHRAQGAGGGGPSPEPGAPRAARGARRVAGADRDRRRRRAPAPRAQPPRRRAAAPRLARAVAAGGTGEARHRSGGGPQRSWRGPARSSSRALEELRELARGLHPAVLTDRGLRAAVEMLAGRAPLPVEIVEVPDERLPEPVEAAAYYLIAEALTNVTKYAEASTVRVRVAARDGCVLVEVSDDGVGGADPAAGSGLRGLADRVEALGGTLEVSSPAGAGTSLRAEIPDTPGV